MTPLDLADLIEPLVVVWLAALIFAVLMRAIAQYQGKHVSRPILIGVLDFLYFGCLLTVFGIVRQANVLGLISFRVYLLAVLAAALAAGCSGSAARLRSPPET
jgi:hypothetical protein